MFDILLVFSSKQEVLFSYGNSLTNNLIRDARLTVTKDTQATLEDRDILMQLFSPLIASHVTMTETLKMPYQCIETEAGHSIFFKNRSDCVLVAISISHIHMRTTTNQPRTREALLEAVDRVEWILDSVFGPCWPLMSPDNLEQRVSCSRLLRLLLDEMWFMETNECNLMFNAIERIHISDQSYMSEANIGQSVKEMTINCLLQCMLKMQRSCEGRMKHLLILIGSKLLCLYSNSNAFKLSTQHTLLLILLCNVLYNRADREPHELYSPGTFGNADSFQSCVEPSSDDEETGFFSNQEESPEHTNKSGRSSGLSMSNSNNDLEKNTVGEYLTNNSELFKQDDASIVTAKDSCNTPSYPSVVDDHLRSLEQNRRISTSEQFPKPEKLKPSKTRSDEQPWINRADSDDPEYFVPFVINIESEATAPQSNSTTSNPGYKITRLLFNSKEGYFTACHIHTLKLFTNIIFIGIEELETTPLSQTVTTHIKQIEDILKNRRRSSLATFRSIQQRLKQFKFDHNSVFNSTLKFLDKQFVRLEKELPKSLNSDDIYHLSVSLETILDNICTGLRRIFCSVVLLFPLNIESRLCHLMINARRSIKKRLRDYLPFLSVKAIRNLAPTGFYTLFPGLVYFTWICRPDDELIVPAPDLDFLKPSKRVKMWRCIDWCRRQCHLFGYGEVYYKDTGLQYTYCQRSISAPSISRFTSVEQSQVGMLELCLVHLSCVPTNIVSLHQTQMVKRLQRRAKDTVLSLGLLT